MSRSERFAAIYDGLPAIAVLVDELALALREGDDIRQDAMAIGRLLATLESDEPQSLAHIQLAAVLAAQGPTLARWIDLGSRLQAGYATRGDLSDLEELARMISRASADDPAEPHTR